MHNYVWTDSVEPDPGVEVAELEWNNVTVPEDGTYALLARWNIDEVPFQQLITSGDLQGRVRADNDLVWRSNHVIELIEAEIHGTSEFAMAGEVPPDDAYLLVTQGSLTPQEVDWEALGPATIEVDPSLDRGGPGFASGLRRVNGQKGKFELPLDGASRLIGPLKFRGSSPVKLTVSPAAGQVKDAGLSLSNPAHYDITFIQLRPTAVKPDGTLVDTPVLASKGLVAGGISFALRILPSK